MPIILGESGVTVAAAAAGGHRPVDSTVAAVLGFASIVGVWWLHFDREASVLSVVQFET